MDNKKESGKNMGEKSEEDLPANRPNTEPLPNPPMPEIHEESTNCVKNPRENTMQGKSSLATDGQHRFKNQRPTQPAKAFRNDCSVSHIVGNLPPYENYSYSMNLPHFVHGRNTVHANAQPRKSYSNVNTQSSQSQSSEIPIVSLRDWEEFQDSPVTISSTRPSQNTAQSANFKTTYRQSATNICSAASTCQKNDQPPHCSPLVNYAPSPYTPQIAPSLTGTSTSYPLPFYRLPPPIPPMPLETPFCVPHSNYPAVPYLPYPSASLLAPPAHQIPPDEVIHNTAPTPQFLPVHNLNQNPNHTMPLPFSPSSSTAHPFQFNEVLDHAHNLFPKSSDGQHLVNYQQQPAVSNPLPHYHIASPLSPSKAYTSFLTLSLYCKHYDTLFPPVPILPCCQDIYRLACPQCKYCIEFVRSIMAELNVFYSTTEGNLKWPETKDVFMNRPEVTRIYNLLKNRILMLPDIYVRPRNGIESHQWVRSIQLALTKFLMEQDQCNHVTDHNTFLLALLASRIGSLPIYELLDFHMYNATPRDKEQVPIGTGRLLPTRNPNVCLSPMKECFTPKKPPVQIVEIPECSIVDAIKKTMNLPSVESEDDETAKKNENYNLF